MVIFRYNKLLFGLPEICTLLCLFCIFSLGATEGGKAFEKPLNCRTNYKCPTYKVVDIVGDMEIRTYHQSYWVATPFINSSTFKPAGDKAFFMLFDYANRSNDRGVELKVTAPILVETYYPLGEKHSHNTSMASPSYKLYYYVDPRFQKNPPRPLQKDLLLVKFPHNAVARRFGEVIDEISIPSEISALEGSLKGTRWETLARGGTSTVAAYNEPEDTVNRTNEAIIWFTN